VTVGRVLVSLRAADALNIAADLVAAGSGMRQARPGYWSWSAEWWPPDWCSSARLAALLGGHVAVSGSAGRRRRAHPATRGTVRGCPVRERLAGHPARWAAVARGAGRPGRRDRRDARRRPRLHRRPRGRVRAGRALPALPRRAKAISGLGLALAARGWCDGSAARSKPATLPRAEPGSPSPFRTTTLSLPKMSSGQVRRHARTRGGCWRGGRVGGCVGEWCSRGP
jgi:hypothetical protein